METIQINFQALVMLCTLFVQNESHMNGHHIFVGPSPPFSRYSDFFFYTQRRTSFQKFLKGAFYAQSNCRITRPRQKALEK